ncbi:MAG TPA: VWA domain-containing protein [Acidobacteriaceae bacterium]|jgi:VWFA-related protein|nr:VWA domain-containing protein [Acidobacteriaceae bacterium]
MIRSRWWLVVSIAVFGSLVVWAAAGQAGANPPQTSEKSEILTFQANANLVLVDVVVRDKGKPVEGLRQSEFQVLEDGKPQTISVFEEHKASDVQESAEAPVLPPHVYGNFPRYRITSAANVLLLDALNTPLNDQNYARQQMLKYLHTIPPGTQIAVFTLASRLRMVSGFTTDAGVIEQALELGHTPTQKSLMTDPEGDQAEKVAEAGVKAELPEMAQEVDEFERDRQIFQDEQRVDITLGAFGELARFLSAVPGRKNLIWVSGGLSRALDPDLSRLNTVGAARFGPAARSVNAELSRARVAVYPVDARALMNLTNSNVANVIAPTEMGMLADTEAAKAEAVQNDITTPQEWGESQLEMKLVAADTGGLAFYNTNAVGKAIEDAIADGENYYTLGYAPQEEKNDGAYHTIAVRMEEGKYELQYRHGYYAVDGGKGTPILSPITAAMEHGVPPLSQVIFEARVLAAGDPELEGLQPTAGPAGKPEQPLAAPVTRYFVDYSIDPHQLVLTDVPGGKQRAELEVTQAVYSPAGRRLNFSDAGLEVTLTAAQMAGDMRTGVRVRQEIDVPAGNVWLRVGVRDVTSGRIGTVEMPVGPGSRD